jgi:hypothetical protein
VIAKAAPGRESGFGSFSDLKNYIERDDLGRVREDCLAAWSHGVASHATAALEMERTVARSRYNGRDPVYHLMASWRPGETIDVETVKLAERALVRSLGAETHQSFSALHYDEEKGRYHLHVGISRVNPETGRVLNTWNDYAKLARAAEWAEREYGLQVDRHANWRKKVGERDFALEAAELGDHAEHQLGRDAEGVRGLDAERTGTTQARDARARAHYSWTAILAREVTPAVKRVLQSSSVGWHDVHAALRPYGVHLEAAGSGYRVVGAEIGQHVKASDIGLEAKALTARLGEFRPPLDDASFNARVDLVREPAKAWTSWADAHRDLAAADLALRKLGRSRGQVRDLLGDRSVPAAMLGVSLQELEERLGPYEPAPAIVALRERETARQAEGIQARVAMLRNDPDLILRPLSQTRSTWERADVERVVRTKLGLGKDDHGAAVDTATRSILARCQVVDLARGVYSTTAIVAEERALFDTARRLSERTNAPQLRAPGAELDAQQREAFAHLATQRQIAIVTGVAGSGKSRLQRDLSAAYRGAGARVVGVAVSGEAARTLATEADISSRTVAKLLSDLDRGREHLGALDVLLIDEAGTLGTEQAQRLFAFAVAGGATVRLLGDEAQHEAVARGAVLRGLVEDLGAYDMANTRRAKHEWLRDAARDLRSGKVAPALDALREHGSIRAYPTHEEAKAHLVQQYIHARSQTLTTEDGSARPREAILLADSNVDMNALNLMIQEAYRKAGQLGQGVEYDTDFGAQIFHVGDTVAIREGKEGTAISKWVNGDRATVAAHLGYGLIRIKRERDGALDVWDTRDRGAIQLGYAMTSYRSQGATVDDVFLLPANSRRGTYVDITRARDTVTIAYGEERVRDFGALMYQAQRAQDKTLVRDSERIDKERMRKEEPRPAITSRATQEVLDGQRKRHQRIGR